jgi:hypothetical protein
MKTKKRASGGRRIMQFCFVSSRKKSFLWCCLAVVMCMGLQQVALSAPKTQVTLYPKNNETVPLNPPGFTWLPIQDAQTYTVQCSQTRDFSIIDYEFSAIHLNVYCPSLSFQPGTWYWRYSASTEASSNSAWSEIHSFIIPADAPLFPQPTLADLIKQVPLNHPRLYIHPENKQSFSTNLRDTYGDLYQAFIHNSNKFLSIPLIPHAPETKNGTELLPENIQPTAALGLDSRVVNQSTEIAANLAFAYLVSGDSQYGERAKDWVMEICSWSPMGETSILSNPGGAFQILSLVSRAYTWAFPFFSEEEQKIVQRIIQIRGNQVFNELLKNQYTVFPYSNFGELAWQCLGEVSIAFIRELEEAETWLGYAMTAFYTLSPAWSDADGGWHEGISHWQSYLDEQIWWLDLLEATFGIDGYQKPFFRQTGDFAMYTNPVGSQIGSFGDGADRHNADKNAIVMGRLASRTGNPYWLWYAAKSATQLRADEITYQEALRAETPEIQGAVPRGIPQSKIFKESGIASLHSRLYFPEGDTFLLFKSSPYGTQSHGYNAQNSFTLFHNNNPLLINSGNLDRYGSPHHKEWMWETLSDNSITIDGQGQTPHSPLATGKMINAFLSDTVDYVAGDATAAYDGRLDEFTRHVFYVKPYCFFILDNLKAPAPVQFESHLHSLEEFTINSQYEIYAKANASRARIAFATPAELIISQVSGCIPASEYETQPQWHLTASTKEKSREANFLTTILTYNSSRNPNIYAQHYKVGECDLYSVKLDIYMIGFLLNPSMKKQKVGMLETDASHLLIIEQHSEGRESKIFAVNASFFQFEDQVFRDAPTRENLLLGNDALKVNAKEDNESQEKTANQ